MRPSLRERLAVSAIVVAFVLLFGMFTWALVESIFLAGPSASPTDTEVRALMAMFGASVLLGIGGALALPMD